MSEDQKPKKLSGMSCPQPMLMTGNLAQQWKKWVQSFKFYMRASGMDEESDGRKVALFLHVIGEKGVDVFNTFGKDEDKVKYDELIELFQNHFAPKANLTYECHNFFTYKQSENESLDDFACALKLRSQNCELGKLQERLVKIMFICNMHQKYNYIRERLLLEDKLDLDKALEVAKAMLASRHQTDALTAEQSSVMYNKTQSRSKSNTRNKSQQQQSKKEVCTKCNQVHRHKCPALSQVCRNCNKVGHFAVCCRSKSKSVKYVESDNNTHQVQSEKQDLFIGHIQSSSSSEWTINININKSQVNCIIDTGSDVNIMSKNVYDSLNIKKVLSKTDIKIKSYTGNSLEVLGQQNLQCKLQLNGTYMTKQINFVIANVNSPTVLGKITCSEIGLIKRVFCVESTNSHMSENNDSQLSFETNQNESKSCHVICPEAMKSQSVQSSQSQSSQSQSSQSQDINLSKLIEYNNSVFTGLGCLPGECVISTNPDVKPKVDAPRKVPFALHQRLQEELEKMENMDVIVKVTEPTEWTWFAPRSLVQNSTQL
ncbi:uncharacterized protein LOC126380308 isoform X1 [Pectinophora gossypiella]|uniref:uncharacterized protein LOC126370233 n=1 Tax=Pectinophora gossypiella TaxID=13191 RepID=UPI00214E1AA3|nr:uncharacterized protein LOC126370233 [Pectinophora gossypiella]XP_049877695.1 uncharacterized protein LOC126374943 [Pectinophora gossypiella]XP_049884849.1 uncharacterized protein LOC126379901 isoform X1 [Pectinophora gossypiella]XP_049885595.1 uncharacterized protein LOC126380308 isoform X1 [Pectinophora gossypiella]